MFLNVSGKTQAIRNMYGEYRLVYNNEIISEKVYPDVKLLPGAQFKPLKKIKLNGVNSILLKRGHALGDIVMTFPIVNYLQEKGKIVHVHTNTRYAIPGVDFIRSNPNICAEAYDLIIDLDWVVEIDHYEKEYFEVNRVDIYAEYLNLKNIGNNWNVKFAEEEVDTEDAVVAIQLKGSTAAKDMNLKPILDGLEKRNIKFYVIDDLKDYNITYKNAVAKQTSVVELMSVFKKVKGVLNFDSGPLWLSHVTNTPAFVIVGPTSGKKITVRHPNSKTTYYDTKLDYGCEFTSTGCGEGGGDCNKQFSCLKAVNYSNLTDKFFTWVEGL